VGIAAGDGEFGDPDADGGVAALGAAEPQPRSSRLNMAKADAARAIGEMRLMATSVTAQHAEGALDWRRL
jgi:hypothetical protein